MNFTQNLRIAVLMTIVTTILLGVAYPLAVTGLAQAFFHDQANGQLIDRNGHVIGSRIIGQAFSSPGYFHGRPSAAGTGYDAANSSGTNLGPTNKKLIDAVTAAVAAAKKENPGAPACPEPCRGDAVTDRAARERRAQLASGKVLGNGAALFAAERQALILHRAGGQRVEDGLRRTAAQHLGRRRARVVRAVAAAAMAGEHGGAVRRGGRIGRLSGVRPGQEPGGQDECGESGRCRETWNDEGLDLFRMIRPKGRAHGAHPAALRHLQGRPEPEGRADRHESAVWPRISRSGTGSSMAARRNGISRCEPFVRPAAFAKCFGVPRRSSPELTASGGGKNGAAL